MREIADYYASELAYLRETAQVFARRNPANAAALLERGKDPDVERLLEGVAFLSAGLRARIDQAGMEIAHGLAELMLPHFLRSLPAASVVEFSPNIKALRSRQCLSRGTQLRAREIEGTSCQFQTCFDVELWPFKVRDARLDQSRSQSPVIHLELDLGEPIPGVLEDRPLRFFLHHSDPGAPAALMLWLTNHLAGITITAEEGEPRHLPAGAVSVLAPGEHAVYPWPKTAPIGYRSILELFALPEKLCFFDLRGLEGCGQLGGVIRVSFEFDRPPALPAAISSETFRLNCTPAINLFEAPGEPIAYTPLMHEAIVRADGIDTRHMEVYDVDSVVVTSRSRGRRRTYASFARVAADGPRRPSCYALRRANSPGDGGVDTYLSLIEPAEAESGDGEVLSLTLQCTNRFLPRRLMIGDINETRTAALFSSYKNITPVSPPVPMALGKEALWRLLSHLALNQRGPADADALRAILRLYNFHAGVDAQLGPVNNRQIDAVLNVEREAVTRLIRGVPVRAVRTTVALDERGFPGQGRAYLFGAALNEFYGSLVNINVASELRVTLSPSKQEHVWPVRVGV